ncbi:MAG: hypothetical protein ACREOP_13315 [Thermodesulfobacteriota bacterium]
MRNIAIFVFAVAAFAAAGMLAHAAEGTVKGSVAYEGMTVEFKHVYMITGPDVFDPKVTVRTLLFTDADIGDKVKACDSVFCATGLVLNGMTVDFGSRPRFNYWVGVNNQLLQIGGTAITADAFKSTADTADHLAGTLIIDDSEVKGPKAEATFGVTLTKAFTAHH